MALRNPDLQTESDTSLTGWGASCKGVQMGGPWSQEERGYHINCLELIIVFLTVKMYLKEQVNKHTLLLIDNQIAVAYINNLGRTVPQATILPLDLWMWCLERGRREHQSRQCCR